MDKIEDAMFDGGLSGNKGGPCHRTLRRHRCSQPGELALIAEPPQIGQVFPVPFDEGGVHAVDTEHNQAGKARAGCVAAGCDGRNQNQCAAESRY